MPVVFWVAHTLTSSRAHIKAALPFSALFHLRCLIANCGAGAVAYGDDGCDVGGCALASAANVNWHKDRAHHGVRLLFLFLDVGVVLWVLMVVALVVS